MSPRPATLSKAFPLLSKYICPSCRCRASQPAQWVSKDALRPARQLYQLHKKPFYPRVPLRNASTIASVTAINAKRDIPHQLEELYRRLSALEHEAGLYANVSQLRLALRGLESKDAVTRIAILGIEDQAGARRLARILLADPLAKEPPWERQLIDGDDRDGRALLLRYGQQPEIDDRHPLVKTLFIPSTILNSHRLEVFVQGLTSTSTAPEEGASSLLIPSLETTSTDGGRLSTVTYPVHKSLVYSNGFTYAAFMSWSVNDQGQDRGGLMVKGAIDGSWNSLQPGIGQANPISPINLSLAEVAVESLRNSLDKSFEFEHAWFDSGLPIISTWLSEGADSSHPLKPSVQRLIGVIINDTTTAIAKDTATQTLEAKSATISPSTRQIIDQGISTWAENAHTELRDRLSAAFVSKSWKRLKWYKLFFRVDDVSAIHTDILQRAWLVDAEKEMIWMHGRIQQSGLLGGPKLQPPPQLNPDAEDESDEESVFGEKPRQLTVGDVVTKDIPPFDTDDGDRPLSAQPYPPLIAMARGQLTRITVPTMQSLAQSLVLQSASTTILSTGISALLYVSISATSVYEAGVIAALGTVWSLRRLQSRWEGARREWKATIKEEGRRVLQVAEGECREAVREGGYVEVDEAGVEDKRGALEAVEKVRGALRTVEESER